MGKIRRIDSGDLPMPTEENKVVNTVNTVCEARIIWESIKDMTVEMFGLPPQPIVKFCTPVNIDTGTDNLLVNYKVAAFLPALETALGKKYVVEMVNKYIKITKFVAE